MKRTIIVIVAMLIAVPPAVKADLIGTVQTFDDVSISDGTACTDCYVNGWFAQLAPDVGQNGSGDNAILYDLGELAGFHLLTFLELDDPDEAFLGNFLDAGVLGVQFDAMHASGADLFLRAFIFDDFSDGFFGGAFSSAGAEILASSSGWTTHTIWFSPSDLLLSEFNNRPGQSAADILSAVSQFGLRHDPGGDGPGNPDRVEAAVYFDNLQLVTVPEPGTLTLLGIGLAAMGLATRRRRV